MCFFCNYYVIIVIITKLNHLVHYINILGVKKSFALKSIFQITLLKITSKHLTNISTLLMMWDHPHYKYTLVTNSSSNPPLLQIHLTSSSVAKRSDWVQDLGFKLQLGSRSRFQTSKVL